MQKKVSHFTIMTCLILFFQACGGGVATEVEEVAQTKKESVLTEDNFVSLAKHHFSKKAKDLLRKDVKDEQNNNRFRSYPGATKFSENENLNVLKITAVTPFNSYVESMQIKTKDRLVIIEVKNKLHVNISLYEGDTLLKSTTESIDKFRSFELDDMKGAL